MMIYPAIDLKDGHCVRLFKGQMDTADVYHKNPSEQARSFQKAGARWLHIVDLDAAVSGSTGNRPAIEAILQTVSIPVQLGGGLRSAEQAEYWLEKGVRRVVFGTVALKSPAEIATVCRRYPGRVAVSLDAKNGEVFSHGWVKGSGVTAADLARALEQDGLASFIYTDIERDGTLQGPSLDSLAAFARGLSTPVIASGGVASLEDLRHLQVLQKDGVAGAIIGRALYTGAFTLKEALDTMASGMASGANSASAADGQKERC